MPTALAEAHRVLKPGGYLFVLEPTADGTMYAPERNAATQDNAEALRKTFDETGKLVTGGGRAFVQPNTVAVLQKC